MRLQEQCEQGQRELIETRYLDSITTLASAEESAWQIKDYDTLSRLYMPLQEARRQARQRSSEGAVNLALTAENAGDIVDSDVIADILPHGQLLLAGWGTIQPAVALRQLARERKLYLETFLAAVFPIAGGGRAVVVVPTEGVQLPAPEPRQMDSLIKLLPAHSLVFRAGELTGTAIPGNSETFARVSAMWEDLHRPFLAAADMQADPIRKMEGYRQTIRVDSACELAHQNLSAVAKQLATAPL